MKKEYNDDYGLSQMTVEEFLKIQNNFKKLIEIYNNDKKIEDEYFLEIIQGNRNYFESIFESYEELLDEVNPHIEHF